MSRKPVRVLLLLIAVALAAAALAHLHGLQLADSVGGLWAWLLSLVFYLVAVDPALFRLHFPMRLNARSNSIAFMLIAALALALRVWRLGALPQTLSGDEANFGLEAARYLHGELRNPFVFGWLSQPTSSFILQAQGLRILGDGIAALRLPSALVGTVAVLAAGWMGTVLAGRRVGLLTAALLAVYHFHIHFSRIAINNIQDTLIGPVAVALLVLGIRHRRPGLIALAGGVAGLGFYAYQGARLISLIVAATLAAWMIRAGRRAGRRIAMNALAAAVGFLLAAAPMLQSAWRWPSDFMARLNQVGAFQSGWLHQAVASGQGTAAGLVADQLRQALGIFAFSPDLNSTYGLGQPLLDPLFGALCLVGLGYATIRCWHRRSWKLAPLAIWWWGGLLTGAVLIIPPPMANRLVTLSVPACFFIAFALDRLTRLAHRTWPTIRTRAILFSTVALFAAISLNTYFHDYIPKGTYGGPHAKLATAIAPRLRSLPAGMPVYFFGAPWMYGKFPTLRYLASNANIRDVIDPLRHPAARGQFATEAGAVFLFLPARSGDLRYVNAAFPEGHARQVCDPDTGELIAIWYEVAPDASSGQGQRP